MLTVLLVGLLPLLYVFAGYPALLRLLVWWRGPRPVRQQDIVPPVSLVISAYNEASVIRERVENALALDYPADRLEIVVVSDGSDDGTDDIVRAYADRGVVLMRQEPRRGKTAGLNAAVPALAGEIVVFSDANAMYERSALRMLVRNFADPAVGCVTGEARYLPAGRTAADVGESTYWSYEIRLKRLETAVGSMVGGDGAIYAIRRSLWRTLPENAINDFLNPLQIVGAGWRGVYEPEAVCYEETAGGFGREYRRRVRIVSRSWRAVFQAPEVLNPFRVRFFAVSVFSHKVLRWLSGVFMVLVAVGAICLLLSAGWSTAAMALAVGAVAVVSVASFPAGRRALSLTAYFVSINAASIVGVTRGTLGRVSGMWTPPRAGEATPGGALSWRLLAAAGASCLIAASVWWAAWPEHRRDISVILFWWSVVALAYIYAGYPAVMWLWRAVARRPVRKAAVEPELCLLITAHNEADVISEKLRNALVLRYPREKLQIVVASDGSTDETNAIVGGFASQGVRLLPFPERRGKIATINRALDRISAEVVVFSDANTFLQPYALCALVAPLADPTVGAVSGDVVLIGERAALAAPEDLYYRYERWVQDMESQVGSMIGTDGALYALRRRLFQAPPDDTILDDMAIPFAVCRAEHRVVFEPRALAYEQGSRSAREEFSRKARVVAGAVQLLERSARLVPWWNAQFVFSLLSHKVLRWFSPAFALVALAGAFGLARTATAYVAIAAAQSIFLAAGVLGCVPAARAFKPVAMAHYFWLVQGAALVGLMRGLAGRQPATWRRFARTPIKRAAEIAAARPTELVR